MTVKEDARIKGENDGSPEQLTSSGELQGNDLAGDRDVWDESLIGVTSDADKLAEVMLGRSDANILNGTCWRYEDGQLTYVVEDPIVSAGLRKFFLSDLG